jgi:hypothetical protein
VTVLDGGTIVHAYSLALAILLPITLAHTASAQAQTFGDFDCTVDCSGHEAGYNWADPHGIDNEEDCPDGNSQSFHEGCIAYTRDSNQGADEDDQGNTVGMPQERPDGDDNDDDDDK